MTDVGLDLDGAVVTLRLRRAARRNVLDSGLIDDLTGAVQQLSARQSIAVTVLSGDGSSFCAGADLRELRELTPATAATYITRLHTLFEAIRLAPQVVIAAVNGYALGAGCELAAACDLRIAADDARFGMPEIRVGIPSVIEAALLVPLIGLGRTADLVYSGDTLSAAEAKQIGLVSRVVPAADLEREALALAHRLAGFSHAALRLQKQLVRAWSEEPLPRSITLSIERFAEAFTGHEPREAMTAFLEQRQPHDQPL